VPSQEIIDSIDHSFIIDKNVPLYKPLKEVVQQENLDLYEVDFLLSFEA